MLHLLYNSFFILRWGRKVSNITHSTFNQCVFVMDRKGRYRSYVSQLFYCFCGKASDMCCAMNKVIICWSWRDERMCCLVTVSSGFQTKCLWCRPSMIMTEGWTTAAAHGRVSLLFACSMSHPFQHSRNGSWDKPVCEDKGKPLHVLRLETQGKWWEGSYWNPKKAELCTCVCLSIERLRKRSWSCILFHSQF